MTLKVDTGLKLGYASDQPVLVVQHQMDRPTLVELLKQWSLARGPQTVRDMVGEALGEPQEDARGLYMVSVDGRSAPHAAHANASIATAEANRLAEQFPNTVVRVLKVVSCRRATTTTKVEVLGG